MQRILNATQIDGDGIAPQVDAIAYDRFRQVCAQHSDALVLAWRKPFTAAAETLEACFARIGPVPLEDTSTIMQAGGDIADVWAQGQTASKVVDTIAAGWTALGEFTRTVPNNPDHRVLRLAVVDPETWQAHNLRRAKLTPWEILTLGLTFTLPTFAEYRRRVQLITDAMAQPVTVVDRQRSLVAGREIRVDSTGREVNAA